MSLYHLSLHISNFDMHDMQPREPQLKLLDEYCSPLDGRAYMIVDGHGAKDANPCGSTTVHGYGFPPRPKL